MENDQVDIAHLIRSIQRLEKSPDCFGVAEFQSHCDCMDCAWRSLCLEKPQDHRIKDHRFRIQFIGPNTLRSAST